MPTISRPNNTEKCSTCFHPFGEHYTTYDVKDSGCSGWKGQKEDGGRCDCRGFTIIYRAPQEPKQSSYQDISYGSMYDR